MKIHLKPAPGLAQVLHASITRCVSQETPSATSSVKTCHSLPKAS